MRKFIRIILIALLMLLIVFSILADMPIGRKWSFDIRLGHYLKLVSLAGLLIALFAAWGYRNKIQSSQKYRRADEVVSQAQEAYERKKEACEQMEKRLHAKYDEKEKGVDDKIEEVRRTYQKRLNELQKQNIELKETVGKLMQTIKQARQKRG
jgi:dsDNA-specific endonuclease/ATPase MutS2